jgi:hypothetical protein
MSEDEAEPEQLNEDNKDDARSSVLVNPRTLEEAMVESVAFLAKQATESAGPDTDPIPQPRILLGFTWQRARD